MPDLFPWPWQELGERLVFYGSGATPRGGKKSYATSGVPLVRSMNVYDFRFEKDNLAHIDGDQATELDRVTIEAGDILLNITGASVARCCIAPERVVGGRVNQHVMLLRVDRNRADSRWLAMALAGPYKSSLLAIAGSGATREALTRSDVRSFRVSFPPIEVQKRSADILYLYDMLIQHNRRRIEILEEMARLLYQEYFIHFRYPGNDDTDLVDSQLGPMPNGWEVLPTSEVVESVGGGTPSRRVDEYWLDGHIRWYTPSDLTRDKSAFVFDSSEKISEQGLKHSSAKLFPAGSVMLTSRATIGEVSIAASDASTNQGFITCVPSDRLTTNYLYFWLLENVPLFESLAGGATFKELRKSTFRELPILAPDKQVMAGFEERVGPMMTLLNNLLRQNAALCTARDLLLPRLVSGELDISDLDSELEAVGV